MIQNLNVTVDGSLSVTQKYPTIIVVQSVTGGVCVFSTTDNLRQKYSADGLLTQIRDRDTLLWHTIMAYQNQVVIGPGEA